VQRLNRETRAFLGTEAVRTRFAEMGGTAGEMSPEDYTEFVRREVAAWAPLVQASGATAD
jgi:tripartite-type tricarboxylate transporter receptor subunit TctC